MNGGPVAAVADCARMHMRMRAHISRTLAAVGLISALFVALPGAASAQSGPASRFLKQRHDEVMRIIRRPAATDPLRQRRTQDVTRILSELLDYEQLSRRALGAHWETRTPEQRQRFVDLLRQLVERNYETNLQNLTDFEVAYTAEGAVADGTTVTTEARSTTERRRPPVEIVYSMRLDGTAWRVFDVNTDGVSLVRTYYTQFNRIITANGWDELIRRMEQRLAGGATE